MYSPITCNCGVQAFYEVQPSLTALHMSQLPHVLYFSIFSVMLLHVYLLLHIRNSIVTWAVGDIHTSQVLAKSLGLVCAMGKVLPLDLQPSS